LACRTQGGGGAAATRADGLGAVAASETRDLQARAHGAADEGRVSDVPDSEQQVKQEDAEGRPSRPYRSTQRQELPR